MVVSELAIYLPGRWDPGLSFYVTTLQLFTLQILSLPSIPFPRPPLPARYPAYMLLTTFNSTTAYIFFLSKNLVLNTLLKTVSKNMEKPTSLQLSSLWRYYIANWDIGDLVQFLGLFGPQIIISCNLLTCSLNIIRCVGLSIDIYI